MRPRVPCGVHVSDAVPSKIKKIIPYTDTHTAPRGLQRGGVLAPFAKAMLSGRLLAAVSRAHDTTRIETTATTKMISKPQLRVPVETNPLRPRAPVRRPGMTMERRLLTFETLIFPLETLGQARRCGGEWKTRRALLHPGLCLPPLCSPTLSLSNGQVTMIRSVVLECKHKVTSDCDQLGR